MGGVLWVTSGASVLAWQPAQLTAEPGEGSPAQAWRVRKRGGAVVGEANPTALLSVPGQGL